MAKVIIAEKPSVAKNIAEAVGAKNRKEGYFEGGGYYVTWAFGHLLELFDAKDYDEKMTSWRMDNFPFIPEPFQYKVKSDAHNRSKMDQGAKRQLDIIAGLIQLPDVEGLISACDYDREGQIIGDIIIDFLGVKKPVERLLLNEWTPKEVQEGLLKLVSNTTMVPLKEAGISRQWADWLIGINLTSVATLKYQRGAGKALNIGRVLLPTLKIIYDRDIEIDQFVREEFHKLMATFKTLDGGLYEGVYQLDGVDRFVDKAPLEAIKSLIQKGQGHVTDVQEEVKREYPPALFNLSGLQGYVTSKQKGWTSDKVLKVAQALYEKKLITYPRTASMALEESLIEKTEKVLQVHKRGLPYENEIAFHTHKRVFDNAKVESHSAIMPTYMVPKGLAGDERVVYEAVKNRFIMQFMPLAEHQEVTIITASDALSAAEQVYGHFISKGRVQLVEGWRQVEKIQSKEKMLPLIQKGAIVQIDKVKVETKGTTPPKRHTEKSLLRVMETCGKKIKHQQKEASASESSDDEHDEEPQETLEGIDVNHTDSQEDAELIQAILSGFSIGTPATRAETITKLHKVGYIAMKGKSLICTEMGRKLVERFPVPSLFDLEYTGRLEKTLSDISKGTISQTDFLHQIQTFTAEAVARIKADDFHVIQTLETTPTHDKEVLGKCPGCQSDVVEGEKGYGCVNWKSGCKFVIWKEDKFLEALQVKMTRAIAIKLLEKGELFGDNFTSKKGTTFSAFLTYVKNQDNPYYSWKMRFLDQAYTNRQGK